MLDALYNSDIHSVTAKYLFDINSTDDPTKDQRYTGKKFNHAKSYRTGPFKIVEMINKEQLITISIKDAKKYDKKWNELYNLDAWWCRIETNLDQNNRVMTTVYRFKRTFLAPWGLDLFKEATAFEPQSTVADHTTGAIQPEIGIKGGILGIYNDVKHNKEIKLVQTAHDSIVIEVPYAIKDEVKGIMIKNMSRPLLINGKQFTIPVDVDEGERWGELEKVKVT